MVLCLILGGAFGFMLLMFALAGSASAATDDSVVSSVSAPTTTVSTNVTVDSSTASVTATVSGDGATVSTNSPSGTADLTVGGDGAKVSADSPAGSADVTVGGDGAKVSADSPAGSAQASVGEKGGKVSVDSPAGGVDATVGGDPSTPPELDVSVGPAIAPNEPIALDEGAQASTALPIGLDRSGTTVPWDLSGSPWLGQGLSEVLTADAPHPIRLPLDPANPIAPEGRSGNAPTSSSFDDHGPGATWSWLILIVLFTSLWYLLTTRSRMPHGVGGVLALPG